MVSRDFLPFPEFVPWQNISLTVEPQAILSYYRHPERTPNPLRFLEAMIKDEPARIRGMQVGLARARWHLLYHRDDVAIDPFSDGEALAKRPSAGLALAHHISRAVDRQAARRATGGGFAGTEERTGADPGAAATPRAGSTVRLQLTPKRTEPI